MVNINFRSYRPCKQHVAIPAIDAPIPMKHAIARTHSWIQEASAFAITGAHLCNMVIHS